jgi:hypothetical protein
VDRYLRLPGLDGLGIKLREGRIEIKQRQRKYGVLHLPGDTPLHERPPQRDAQDKELEPGNASAGRAVGQVESWRKWSFGLANRPLARLATPAASWIAVRKARSLRIYQIGENQRVVPLATGDDALQGCSMELTDVEVFGQAWWTLGLEAFGDESALQEGLLTVAGHVVASHLPVALDVQDSYGYPKWLDLVSSRAGSSKGGKR